MPLHAIAHFDPLSAANPQTLALLASLLLGLAVFLFVSRLLLLLDRHVRTVAEAWEFEQVRRVKLRLGCRVYRGSEPLIDELAACSWLRLLPLQKLELALARGADPLPWTAREYAASLLIESLLLGLGVAFFGSAVMSLAASITAGLCLASAYLRAGLRVPVSAAAERVSRLCQRLPFGVDQIALMMQAGAGLRDALTTIVAEGPNHPFCTEFHRVLHDFNRGRTLHEALADLDRRMQSPEIREMVLSIQKSEELGTPLADIFANLAQQLRLKKSQWAEAEAGRAQVRIQGPSIIILIACMITIVAPFIFQYFLEAGQTG